MKVKTLLWLCLVIPFLSQAQDSLPPIFEIRDTSVTTISDPFWQMLENREGKLGFPEVMRSTGFHKNTTEKEGMGYGGVKDYWIRFRLQNLTGSDQDLVFSSNRWNYKRDYYVIRDSGMVEHLRTGWGVPLSEKDTFRTKNGILVPVRAGETIQIYGRLRLFFSDFNSSFTLSFRYKDHYLRDEYINQKLYIGDTRFAFIAGVLVLGFILNLFFFRIAKERMYLYYSLVLLLEAVWFLVRGTWLFFKESPELLFWFDIIVTFGLFFLCVTQFVRHFLKTPKYYPRWDRFIVVLAFITVLFNLGQVYWQSHLPYSWRGAPRALFGILFATWMFCLLISFFLKKKESDRYTNLAILGVVPVIFIWTFVYGVDNLSSALAERTGKPRPAWVETLDSYDDVIELYCIAWFAFWFTWILTQQYGILRKQLTQQALAREKEKNEMMARQQVELEEQVQERTAELKNSIDNLKNTQQQLIQSEKMASLGELTAGIAHEIQNPLNFVNNFADINTELIDEMLNDLAAGNSQSVAALAQNIKENNEKINYHGKRADSIVKGMLQHSRNSSGQKELTDINALVDECMRLSYHGLRAKDKTFNCKTETDLDNSLPKVNIAPQDIGRVILNLFTNAFYSVMQKKKKLGDAYEPVVLAKTAKMDKGITITIRDNGNGVPQKVLDKIFQPFFTTKPVGEGTGLGLSMSYDIITKGHNGELKVETKEGEYAEFTIILPV